MFSCNKNTYFSLCVNFAILLMNQLNLLGFERFLYMYDFINGSINGSYKFKIF